MALQDGSFRDPTSAIPRPRPRRVAHLALITIFMIAASFILFAGDPSTANASDDYPYKAQSNENVDPWGFYYLNCTSFVAWRINSTVGPFSNGMEGGRWGHGGEWDSNAAALGYLVDRNPEAGSVAQWHADEKPGSGVGHVAWVVAANADGTVDIEEYNAQGDFRYGTRRIPASEVPRFIHVRARGNFSGEWVTPSAGGLTFPLQVAIRVTSPNRPSYVDVTANRPGSVGPWPILCRISVPNPITGLYECTVNGMPFFTSIGSAITLSADAWTGSCGSYRLAFAGFREMTLLSAATAAAVPAAADCGQPAPGGGGGSGTAPASGAIVYDTQGSSAWESFAAGETRNLTTLDNKVSFIVTPSGIELVCSTEPNMVPGNISRWGPGSHDLTGSGHDNQISSCRAEVLGTAAGVTIYDGTNYTGDFLVIGTGKTNLGALCDRGSSFQVHGDVHVVFFDGLDQTGNLSHWDASQSQLGGYDNTFCSVEVYEHQTTPPADTFIISAPNACNAPGLVTIAFGAQNGTEFATQLNSGGWSGFSTATSVSYDLRTTGTNVVQVKARGPGGEDATPASTAFEVDADPPTITFTQTGSAGARGWFVGPTPPSTAIASADTGCGKGNLTAIYSADGGAAAPYSGPVTLASPVGRHVITAVVRDGVGNTTSQSINVNYDNSKPKTGNKINTQKTTLPDGRGRVVVTYEVTCEDPESGCYESYYSPYSAGPWTKYTGPVVLADVTVACGTTYAKSFSTSNYTWAENEAGLKSSAARSTVSTSVSLTSSCSNTPTPTPAPGCSITSGYSSVTLSGGTSMTIPVTVKSQGGFAQPVSLTVSGLPSGVSGSLSPLTLTPTSSGVKTYLTLTSTASTPRGQSTTVEIRATAASGVTCVGYIRVGT